MGASHFLDVIYIIMRVEYCQTLFIIFLKKVSISLQIIFDNYIINTFLYLILYFLFFLKKEL